jgi:hypothetical protein
MLMTSMAKVPSRHRSMKYLLGILRLNCQLYHPGGRAISKVTTVICHLEYSVGIPSELCYLVSEEV